MCKYVCTHAGRYLVTYKLTYVIDYSYIRIFSCRLCSNICVIMCICISMDVSKHTRS